VGRLLRVFLLLAVVSTTLLAADQTETDGKDVIQRFHEALDRQDVAAIGGLVSPDVVAFENGHRPWSPSFQKT
jgi:ketosteroid isomerase-like protein